MPWWIDYVCSKGINCQLDLLVPATTKLEKEGRVVISKRLPSLQVPHLLLEIAHQHQHQRHAIEIDPCQAGWR